MTKRAIVTVGVSCSGKSTFAKEWVSKDDGTQRIEINRDVIRWELMEKDGITPCWKSWKWNREKEVTSIVNDLISFSALHGLDVIISDTNLNAERRGNMLKLLESYGYVVELKEFPITLEEAWDRDASRVNGVGHSVIATQYELWLNYIGRRTYVPDVTKPKAILVDIDGTLAHMNGKRGAFEWSKVEVDDVDEQVKFIVNLVGSRHTEHIIILSGRDGCCYDSTFKWLVDNYVQFDKLIMRTHNDMRDDRIVKSEIFWRDIADNYNIQFVIDDRPKVIRAWQEIGIKVFAVGNQSIEF